MDHSTPMTGVNDCPRMRHLGQYYPIPEIQPSRSPIRSAQLDLCCVISSPAVLVAETQDILAQVQSDLHTVKMASPIRSSPELRTVPVSHRPGRFTNTAVPRFSRWDDETAALQLFSSLEGDALNVALLQPEAQRATRSGLSGALSDHSSSPGRLAIYPRKIESVVQRDEEDPSMFAMELEI